MLGMGELLVILLIVLLIFGAGKLPAIGDALGRSLKNFRRAAAGTDEIEVARDKRDEISAKKKPELDEGDDDFEDAEVVSDKKKRATKEA